MGSIVSGVIVGGDKDKFIASPGSYGLTGSPKQAELLRMGEVLNALGVPRSNSQAPSADTTYSRDAHFNHFHVNVKPPALVDIETTANLFATQDEAAPMVLAAGPKSTATDASVTASSDSASSSEPQYDKVYSACSYKHSADQSSYNIATDNWLSPLQAISLYFESQDIFLNLITGKGEPESIQTKVLKSPEHGKLVPDVGASYMYYANQGYLGSDQIVFEVEILGKKFKIIQTVVIDNSGNLDHPTKAAIETLHKICPEYNRSSLDIIELPTGGSASDEELAMLHSMISFAIGQVAGYPPARGRGWWAVANTRLTGRLSLCRTDA